MTRRMAAAGAAVTTAVAAAAFALTAPASAGPAAAVQGTVAGSYTDVQTNPDMGRLYRVTGVGHTSLGRTHAHGRIGGPGNVQYGRCAGRLTLKTADGTLVVKVRSMHRVGSFATCQSGFGFTWRTVDATGSYAGDSPSGTGTLTLVKPSHASSTPPPAYVTFDPAA